MPRTPLPWQCRDRWLVTGPRTLVMGILNLTPDSFFDGGKWTDPDAAVSHALTMARDGADIIDLGGESTRPGAQPVPPDVELERVMPVLRRLRMVAPDLVISVDTRRGIVARAALEAGAHIINDVSALSDPETVAAVAEYGAGVVLMHMQGEPATMQDHPQYADVTREVVEFLRHRMAAVERLGVRRDCIVLDPGIGFGKTPAHNLQLIRDLPALVRLGRPVLIGVSRKSIVGHLTGRPVQQRLPGTLALTTIAVLRGASIVRAHDVRETCDALRVTDRMLAEVCDALDVD